MHFQITLSAIPAQFIYTVAYRKELSKVDKQRQSFNAYLLLGECNSNRNSNDCGFTDKVMGMYVFIGLITDTDLGIILQDNISSVVSLIIQSLFIHNILTLNEGASMYHKKVLHLSTSSKDQSLPTKKQKRSLFLILIVCVIRYTFLLCILESLLANNKV